MKSNVLNTFNYVLETKNNLPLYISLGVIGGLIVVAVIVILAVFFARKNKLNKLNNETKEILNSMYSEVCTALGGKDNIVNVAQNLSRVTISVEDISKVDNEKLKTLEVNVAIMSSKVILSIGDSAEDFKNEFVSYLESI